MPCARLYHTPKEQQEASCLKSARYYARHKEKIKEWRVLKAITQASATFRKKEKAQDYVKRAQECVGRPVKKHTVVKKYKLRPEHDSPDQEYSSPRTQSFLELCTNAAQTSTTLQLYEPEGQFRDSEDLREDGEEDDHEESMHLWEEAPVTRMQNGTETSSTHFCDKENVTFAEKTDCLHCSQTEPSYRPTHDKRPSWLHELHNYQLKLLALYRTVGASSTRDFLPKLYAAHIHNFRHQYCIDLLHEKHDHLASFEPLLQKLHNEVWSQYESRSWEKRFVKKILDRTTKMRVYVGKMILIDLCGTDGLIDEYNCGRLPFQ
ncbi:hypothetical protein Moror_2291 [Moniliophthora roreri MCA 2997]|uniref:Uncharacterized protein n=1 Tax=Moniliophthora roreri (strain MCA 2997) TaxID=1381753 RepID=V2WKY3_MONRO|nr:hypothetical protein Moror_2291 [Moniliophthora roreri MCA 2997]